MKSPEKKTKKAPQETDLPHSTSFSASEVAVCEKNEEVELTPAAKKAKTSTEAETPLEEFDYEADVSSYPPFLPLSTLYSKSYNEEKRKKYWHSHLIAKYELQFPQDFYDFWEFSCEVQKMLSLPSSLPGRSTLSVFSDVLDGIVLCGPYEEIAGLFQETDQKEVCYSLHDRYFYDPPEFLTVFKQSANKGEEDKKVSDSGKSKSKSNVAFSPPHWGYVRDNPAEFPAFVAFSEGGESATFAPAGDNLFHVLKLLIDGKMKQKDESVVHQLNSLSTKLTEYASTHDYDIKVTATKGKHYAQRQKKIIANTFSKLGIVVPFKNEVGYREFPLTDTQLKKLFGKMASEAKKGWKVNFDELDELKTLNTLSNDECDPGMGLQFGLNMFASTEADKLLQREIYSVLSQAYELLGRSLFAKITKLHVRYRYHSLHNQRLPRKSMSMHS